MRNSVALVGLVLGMMSVAPAFAYDPQCDKIRNAQRRDLCQCRTDAGASVRVSPNQRGEVTVRETGVPSRRLGEVQACMARKGHGAA